MACKRWSFSSTYSYSIGRVIGFKPKSDVTSGLTVELTDGFRCYNKHKNEMKNAKTIIDLVCDTNAGVGRPTSMGNFSGLFVSFIRSCEVVIFIGHFNIP